MTTVLYLTISGSLLIYFVIAILIVILIFRIFWNWGDEFFGLETDEQILKRKERERRERLEKRRWEDMDPSEMDEWINAHYNDKNIKANKR